MDLYVETIGSEKWTLLFALDAGKNASGLALKFRSNFLDSAGDLKRSSTVVALFVIGVGSYFFLTCSGDGRVAVAVRVLAAESVMWPPLVVSCTVSLRRGTWCSMENWVRRVSAATLALVLSPAEGDSNRLRASVAGRALWWSVDGGWRDLSSVSLKLVSICFMLVL